MTHFRAKAIDAQCLIYFTLEWRHPNSLIWDGLSSRVYVAHTKRVAGLVHFIALRLVRSSLVAVTTSPLSST
jgi:hypothetical protein